MRQIGKGKDRNLRDVYNNTTGSTSNLRLPKSKLTPSGIVDAKLQGFFDYAIESEKNSSKIVDENGEPLVAYHLSPVKDITTFDKERAGEHTGAYGDDAIYATDSEDVADVFSHEMSQGSTSFTTRLGIEERCIRCTWI